MITRLFLLTLWVVVTFLALGGLGVSIAAAYKSTQPTIIALGNTHPYQKIAVISGVYCIAMLAASVWLFVKFVKRKPQPPASHF